MTQIIVQDRDAVVAERRMRETFEEIQSLIKSVQRQHERIAELLSTLSPLN
jgi:hypothetical protein